jgi:hypothetical protein
MAEAGAGTSLMREVLPAIVLGVLGTVLLIVGTVAGSITAGIGVYILSTFNSSGITIPQSYNYLQAITGLIPIIFTLIGIALLVAAAVVAIVVLLRSVGAMRTETGLGV